MFRWRLDGSSGVPPYLQLVHQVRQALLLGYLREGDRLPTVKDVAADLVINPNTVVWRPGCAPPRRPDSTTTQ
jgi:GntR family transcriptional regulator